MFPTSIDSDQLTRVNQRIHERALDYFPELVGRELTLDCYALDVPSTYPLFVVDVYSPRDPKPSASIVIKFAPVFEDNNEGQTEFDNMTLFVERAGSNDTVRVPRPIDFYPEENALLMERVDGELLLSMLLRECRYLAQPSGLQRTADAVARCGQWLTRYHNLTAGAEAPVFDSAFEKEMVRRFGELETFGFPAEVLRALRRALAKLTRFGAHNTAPVAKPHGDFGPSNVIVRPEAIYVFDLNYHLPSCVYDDIAFFVTTLETINPFPRHPLFNRRRAVALRDVFLRAYFDRVDTSPTSGLLLEGHVLKSLLRLCVKQQTRAAVSRGVTGVVARTKARSFYPRRVARQCQRIENLLSVA